MREAENGEIQTNFVKNELDGGEKAKRDEIIKAQDISPKTEELSRKRWHLMEQRQRGIFRNENRTFWWRIRTAKNGRKKRKIRNARERSNRGRLELLRNCGRKRNQNNKRKAET